MEMNFSIDVVLKQSMLCLKGHSSFNRAKEASENNEPQLQRTFRKWATYFLSAVIADEWVDQLMRSSPLFVIPLVMPVNMDMLFITYAIFFYFYGVYLHSGHELESLSAHNPYFNTSFQVIIRLMIVPTLIQL